MNFAGRGSEMIETLVQQARALTDEDRWELARARKAIDETFHASAWRAAKEMVTARAEVYTQAWVRIGSSFVPDRLEELVRMGSTADPEVVAEWHDVARLVRVGLDDALLALLTADSIPPPNIRELYGPWKAMLEAAHQRRASEAAS